MNKQKVHDGILGIVIFLSVALGYYVDSLWLLLPAILGLTMLQSAFSGFCPLYYTLNKMDSKD